MSISALKFISEKLERLKIPYAFEEWTANEVPDPYFVGEYNEVESTEREENGYQETTFILTGTGRKWLGLEQAKEIIENNITETAILPNGNGIAVFYSNSFPVPTGDAELKRIQINLTIKEWRVN
jgi:hypothetical protein|nr:MAG TPA: hypothetical protein [Caudoviricetes sp.]